MSLSHLAQLLEEVDEHYRATFVQVQEIVPSFGVDQDCLVVLADFRLVVVLAPVLVPAPLVLDLVLISEQQQDCSELHHLQD